LCDRFQDSVKEAEWHSGRAPFATDEVRHGHGWRKRFVQAGHGYETKAVQVIRQTYDVVAEERRFAEALYPMVQDSIRDGVYPPHRGSPLCSRRHCGYWRECEREFGGRVSE
jgi:hypothetical protein